MAWRSPSSIELGELDLLLGREQGNPAHVLEEELESVRAGVGLEVQLARRTVRGLGDLRQALAGLGLLEQLDADLVEVAVQVLGRALVEGHALDRLRDLVDAQEALLLTTGQESLDLLQLDHLTHRHVLTSGWTPSEHVGPSTHPPPGARTNVRSDTATASFLEVKGPARISEHTSARRAPNL